MMKARRYRKKPVVIEAICWADHTMEEIMAFCPPIAKQHEFLSHTEKAVEKDTLLIPTIEGLMTARRGDWIIKGVQGEFYPCHPDVFAATYELVDD